MLGVPQVPPPPFSTVQMADGSSGQPSHHETDAQAHTYLYQEGAGSGNCHWSSSFGVLWATIRSPVLTLWASQAMLSEPGATPGDSQLTPPDAQFSDQAGSAAQPSVLED